MIDHEAFSWTEFGVAAREVTGLAEARSAVLYRKPGSLIDPDYSWRLTENWIDFPWSVEPVMTGDR